jgi:hypothetical protein
MECSLGNTKKVLKYILRRHSFNSDEKASKYMRGMGHIKIKGLIKEAAKTSAAWEVQSSSRVLIANMGRVIGTDHAGNAVSGMRVGIDSSGHYRTSNHSVMTTVHLRLDEESLVEDLRCSPETANLAGLEETCYIMPIRWCMNGVELLELPNHSRQNLFIGAAEQSVQRIELTEEARCWLPLPLLGFVTHALQALNVTMPSRDQDLNLAVGGHLVLARHNDPISIESSINGSRFSIQLAEALNAFHASSDKVRQMLVSCVPAMQNHPSWKQQLPDPIA